MNRKRTHLIVFKSIIVILLILFIECSSDLKPVISDQLPLDQSFDVISSDTQRNISNLEDRFYNDLKSLDFPVRSSIISQNSGKNAIIRFIGKEVKLFYQVNGHLPDSINDLVEKGFLLYSGIIIEKKKY